MHCGLFKSMIIGLLCAQYSSAALSAPTLPGWENQFVSIIQQHPSITAARQQLNAGLASAASLGQPLYNPELDSELESEGSDTNFRIGLSQSLDWWDRQSVSQQQGRHSSAQARHRFELVVQQAYAEGLRAMAERESALELAQLAQTRQQQQQQILKLIEQRQQAGDLGQVDANLAYLGLTQKVADAALANVELKRSQVRMARLLPGLAPRQNIPQRLWQRIDALATTTDTQPWLATHPAVLAARAAWQHQQQSTQLVRLQAKNDPVFGIQAGTSGDDNVLALTFSMPINLHNDFSSNISAANQLTLAEEANYHAQMKNQATELQASYDIMQEYAQRYDEWTTLLRGRSDQGDELLKRLWNSGEISTVEYINILQQGTEALAAGIELKKQFDLSRIDWLFNSGQIAVLLGQPATQEQ